MQTAIEREVADLHLAFAEALIRFASTFTPDASATHDAVQEAFLRYFIERRYGRMILNPQAWLYRVVRNYMLDRIKNAATRHEVAVQHAERVPSSQINPEITLEASETARKIAQTLSRRELECLRLRANGLSYDEIGQSMIVSSGTVAAMLARAHTKLRTVGEGSTFAVTREALRFLAMEVLPEPS